MKKYIFRIAALALVGVCMTACSSGDDEATNEKVTPQPSKDKIVTLTGSLTAGTPTTRSLITEDANGALATWQSGDQVKIRYQKEDNSFGEVTATISGSGVTCTYTAELTNPKNGGAIYYVYPASCYNSSSAPYFSSTTLNSQAGTLADIGTNHNIQTSSSTMNITNDVAIPATNPLPMTPQVCIAKFNLKSSDGKANLYASQLTVAVSGGNTYTVTTSTKQSTFYVAMLPTSGNTVTVTANTPGYTTTGATELTSDNVTAMTTSNVGMIIATDPDNSNQAYLCASTGATTTVSKEFTSSTNLQAGGFYPQDVKLGTLVPIAVVAHVGAVTNYCSKFIALALDDATTAVGTAAAGKTAVETWVGNHAAKIAGTTYKADNMGQRKSGDPFQSYDAVPSGTNNSNQTATSEIKGWRVPTVTDWRYVIAGLGGHDSVTGHSATDPVGVADNGTYYSGSTKPEYYKGIDAKCQNSVMANHGNSCIYWTGSTASGESSSKVWRYNFVHDYFMWVEPGDNAFVRTVIAY